MEAELDPKHCHYLSKYNANELFWGIGIENETYLQFNSSLIVSSEFLKNNWKRERWSVNYYKNYKSGIYQESVNKYIVDNGDKYSMSQLINAHSFINSDRYGNPRNLEGKLLEVNPDFTGKTLYEFLEESDIYFRNERGKKMTFDGDTIEFTTQNFYKSNIPAVIKELSDIKQEFIQKIREQFTKNDIFIDKGDISIASVNYPFASMNTNPGFYSIFNNMTYHFNITMPTELNSSHCIADRDLFTKQHQNAIKILQWIEPVFVAIYGSGDFLSTVNSSLTPTSQRSALSRYIGIGSYDVEKMGTGKILQVSTTELSTDFWYNQYHANSGYTPLEMIGLDINFNKFVNHGLEIRFFDYFPEDKLEEVLTIIVKLMDLSLIKGDNIPIAYKSAEWNRFVVDVISRGKSAIITPQFAEIIESIFGIYPAEYTTEQFYHQLREYLDGVRGQCSDVFLPP
jgi:hypothetical protein